MTRLDRGEKLLAVWLTAMMVCSVFAGTVVLSSGTASAAGNTTPSRFEVVDVGSQNGNLTVTLQGTSDVEVDDFNFTYNKTTNSDTAGPLEFSNATAFKGAQYDNNSWRNPGSTISLSQNSGNEGKVTFIFDSRKNGFDPAYSATTRINVTGYDGTYASADTGNRSVLTANRYKLDAQDHNSNSIKNLPIMVYNADTNQSGGFVFLGTGTKNFHCRGVDIGGTCTNPDTDETSSVTPAFKDWAVSAPVSYQAFALAESNASAKTEVNAGTTTLTIDEPTAPVFLNWGSFLQGSPSPNVDTVTITDASGTVVFNKTGISFGNGINEPVFLKPNTQYTFSLENRSSFGTVNRSVVIPTKGLTGVSLKIATGSPDTSEVTAQVVNESGVPVSDATVIAQPEYASGSRLEVYNSTTTDSNGLFSMTVPDTDQFGGGLAFRIVGTDTSDGTPIYYPTTDGNDGEGYTVKDGKTILPQMELKKGGRVDINVTNGSQKLPVGQAFTSLSQASAAYPDLTRTANSNTFTTLSFGQTPTSASVAMLSPTTGSETQVAYNVWGDPFGSRSTYLCANNVAVSQGQDTNSKCSLDEGGAINLSVEQYGSIIQQQSSGYADVQNFGFFFRNELIIRNQSSGKLTSYLGPDGAQQFFLGRNNNANNVTIPVPKGNYTLELRPSHEFAPWTTVNDTARVEVNVSETKDVTLDRGRRLYIEPVFNRIDRSLTRSGDNTIAVRAADSVTGNILDEGTINATVQLYHQNGTTASDRVNLSHNTTDNTFDNTSFTPKDLGVDAGMYDIGVTASYSDGSRTYNTTIRGPVEISGFKTSVDLGSRSVSPGSNLRGLVAGHNGSSGIEATAGNVDIEIIDDNGKTVSTSNPTNDISNGQGSFSVSMPDKTGEYIVLVNVESKNSGQGFARRRVKVSQIDLSIETDKRTYHPSDAVVLDVEATNATNGNNITDATVTTRVNGNKTKTGLDSNGEATINIAPGTGSDSSSWESGHPITVTVTQETATGVVRKSEYTGFDVRNFETRAEPTNRSFEPSESAKIDVYVPTNKNVNWVNVKELDGDGSVNKTGSKVTEGLWRVDLDQLSAGRHVATATVNTDSGTETAKTGFGVKQYEIATSLNKRSVQTGESVNLTVGVRYPDNGTAVSGESVAVSLNSTDPEFKVDGGSSQTDSNGEASFSLTSDQGGNHYLEVTVGNEERYTGLTVSNVSARLEDSSGNPVEGYEAEPGTSQTIYVNATRSDGSDVSDGANVTAFVDAFDERIELGYNTTANGEATIEFDVPQSIPAREFGLGIRVTADAGTGTTTGVLNVTGGNAKQIVAKTNESNYATGDTARLRADVTTGDGSAVANEDVDFVLQSEGSAETRVATVSTNSDGVATYDYDVQSDATDGQYVLKTALNDSSDIKDYTGYRVRGIDVAVEAEDGPFAPGDTVSLTVSANDSATDDAVTATGGSLQLTLPGSNVEKSLSLSGSAPYDVLVDIPNEGDVTGTRGVSVTIRKDRTSDTDSTLVDVENDTESANLSVSTPVTAGQSTTVTVNGTVDTTAVLTAYSPDAETVAYNDSVSVSSSTDTTKSMTIDSPGTYIVKLAVPDVGTLTEVVDVEASGSDPTVWTGTDVGTNATTFTTSEDIYLKTNKEGMTATVISRNSTYTVALDSSDSGVHYGVLSANRASDIYLVRLDSEEATSLDDSIIEVSD